MSKVGETKNRDNRWDHVSPRIKAAETGTHKLLMACQLLAATIRRHRAHDRALVERLTRLLIDEAKSIEEEAGQ